MKGEKIVRLEPRTVSGVFPPHDLDAEAICLEALAVRPEKRDDLLAILKQEHFFSDANGWIFAAVQALADEGRAVDLVSISSWLRDRGRLTEIGGAPYIKQIVDCTPYALHVEQHANGVIDKWRLRQFIAHCQKYAAEGYSDVGEVDKFIGDAASKIDALAQAEGRARVEHVGPAVAEAWQELLESTKRQGMMGLSTGLRSLDRRLGGLRAGRVTVIGARASMGKTALARCIVAAAAEQGAASAMFSMEMTRPELVTDWAFTFARVSKDKLKSEGGLGEGEWTRLAAAAKYIESLPLWIDDEPNLSMRKLRAKARQIKADAKKRGSTLGLIAIDYLQLMDGSEGLAKGANREQEIAKLSRAMKVLAGELGVHVLLLSQINRGPEGRQVSNKRPTMAELRESGAIENDADNVILVYRDEYYNPDTPDRGIAELILAKQRSGRRNVTVKVAFAAWCTRFDDLTTEEAPEGYDQ